MKTIPCPYCGFPMWIIDDKTKKHGYYLRCIHCNIWTEPE